MHRREGELLLPQNTGGCSPPLPHSPPHPGGAGVSQMNSTACFGGISRRALHVSKASVQHLCSSEQQPMPERKEGKKKNYSLEPSCCKDAIPAAGSLKDKHVVPHLLLAPLIFCSSASRPTERQLAQPCSNTGVG